MSVINLRTHDGRHYVAAEIDGVVVANRTAAGPWESWTVEDQGGGAVALRSHHGRYLAAELDGSVVANREKVGIWETWQRVAQPGGGVSFRSHHGGYLVAEGGGGGVVRADRTAVGPWETFDPIGESPSASHIDPLVGQVGLVRGAFAAGRDPRNICAFHAGDWIGQAMQFGPGRIAGAVDYLASIGVQVARCWFQLKTIPGRSPFWESKPSPRWNPADDPSAFKAAIDVFTSRGIKLHLAGGGIKDMSNAEEDAAFGVLRDTVAEFGPEHFALIEACNEIRDTGDEDDIDPRELTRLVNIVRDRFPQILYGLSAYTGTEDRPTLRTYTPDWMRFYIQHDYRDGRFHDKARHLFSGAYEGVVVRRNCWHGEPFGVVGKSRLVSAQENGHELDAHTMPMAAAMAAMTRGVWTYMSGPGVIFGVEPIEDLPGLPETSAIMRALPQDVGTFDTLGHSGPSSRGRRIHAVREDAPDVRADYAIGSDGRYVEIIYGPPDQRKDLPQERRTTGDKVLLDGPWGRVITGRVS